MIKLIFHVIKARIPATAKIARSDISKQQIPNMVFALRNLKFANPETRNSVWNIEKTVKKNLILTLKFSL